VRARVRVRARLRVSVSVRGRGRVRIWARVRIRALLREARRLEEGHLPLEPQVELVAYWAKLSVGLGPCTPGCLAYEHVRST